MAKTVVTKKQFKILKEAWMAEVGNGHEHGFIQDMRLDYAGCTNYIELERAFTDLMKQGIVKHPMERTTLDGQAVVRFQFADAFKVDLYEDFVLLFTTMEGASQPIMKGGEKSMAKETTTTHVLSAYDTARQVLKADKVKTDQSTTKQSLMESLLKSKEPKYRALGKAIKDEIDAKVNAKAEKAKAKADAAKSKIAMKAAEDAAKAKAAAAKVKEKATADKAAKALASKAAAAV